MLGSRPDRVRKKVHLVTNKGPTSKSISIPPHYNRVPGAILEEEIAFSPHILPGRISRIMFWRSKKESFIGEGPRLASRVARLAAEQRVPSGGSCIVGVDCI